MKEYKSEVFRYDDLNWSEEEVQKVKDEAEACRAAHNGTMELLEGHVTRNKAFGPTLSYYAIPEHWPGLLVMWEEEENEAQSDSEEDAFRDCDSNCVGCDRACADRIPVSKSQEDEEEEQEYEVTIEYAYRIAKKFTAKPSEAESKADEFSKSVDEEILDGNFEIDYALCDAAGRTIIDWN